MIHYWHGGALKNKQAPPAQLTLLEFLRDSEKLTGTKEGCASGDCGACTVVLVSLINNQLHYEAVNSCLMPVGDIQGKALITIEDLSSEDRLHPLQHAFVEEHASQCGFCTPGFLMSAFALKKSVESPSEADIDEALGGNLCRCTGYSPIVRAVKASDCRQDKFALIEEELKQDLAAINAASNLSFMQPSSVEALCKLKLLHPSARIVAGGTDMMLEVTQQLQCYDQMISTLAVPEMNQLVVEGARWTVGGAVSLTQLMDQALAHSFNPLVELLERFASRQIRNRATLGGSLANASPIGDLAPLMLSLEANLEIASPGQRRSVPIHQFFKSYRQTAILANEVIVSISFDIPKASHLAFEKVSKRLDDDISAVAIGINLCLNDHKIDKIILGFGGMAATPAIAKYTCDQLVGLDPDSLTKNELRTWLANDFQPLSDLRASAAYRIEVATNLVYEHLKAVSTSTAKEPSL